MSTHSPDNLYKEKKHFFFLQKVNILSTFTHTNNTRIHCHNHKATQIKKNLTNIEELI